MIMIDPRYEFTFPETTYGVHLWNEMWRREGADKDGQYHPDTLYEQFKKKYL